MAKRFTDTNKYRKPFMRGLSGAYKLLWDFLYHDCDHAGIWIVDFDIAQLYIGNDMVIKKEVALSCFNTGEIRIVELDGGKKWFIPSFIDFQYGKLSEKNNAHTGVIKALNKYNLLFDDLKIKPLISSSYGVKDKEEEKDMDKEKEKEQKKTFNTRPNATDFNGLPNQYINSAIELIFQVGQSLISSETVLKMWEIFKIQELTGCEYYANEGKVYSHFTNWIKKQKFSNGTNQSATSANKFTAGQEKLLAKGQRVYADITGKQDN